MSSRAISLSKQRDLVEWEQYLTELKTAGGIWRRREQIQEFQGDKAASRVVSQHCQRYDPTEGSLNYAVQHNRYKLLNLILESGKS
jgi:hypothetical protein